LQVTRLARGGFIIALRLNHTMADGLGIVQFLTAVGEIAHGASAPVVQPVWERDRLIIRTLPKHRTQDHDQEINSLLEYWYFFGPKEICTLKQQVTSCSSTAF